MIHVYYPDMFTACFIVYLLITYAIGLGFFFFDNDELSKLIALVAPVSLPILLFFSVKDKLWKNNKSSMK